MNYISTAFSPMMIREKSGLEATITEIKIREIPTNITSIVGHEITAKILSALLQTEIAYNRKTIELNIFDNLYVVIPKFRTTETREFTHEEVRDAGFRCFHVELN